MMRRLDWKNLGDTVSRRVWKLDSEALYEGAQQKTGLTDFGEPPLEPALSALVTSLNEEANLSPLGRFLMRSHLTELLEVRLKLVQEWRRHAEALTATSIEAPVFITGMPRSGSTFLHELLAEDPDHRAPRVWEVMFPLSPPGTERSSPAGRIRKTAARLWWFRRLAPGADAVHPLRAETPQECVAIHSYTLHSEEFLSTCRVAGYEAFLHATDLRPAYAWQKRFLQYLQMGGPEKRWILKSPDHVYGLEELFSVFPDAVVIQTHRDPLEVLPSSTQLVEVLHGLFAGSVDGAQIRMREAQVLATAMERFMEFRDRHPELTGRFIDVKYDELAAEPMAVLRRIYKHLERPLTEEAAGRMRLLAGNRSRYRRKGSTGALGNLEFDVLTEACLFSRYCLRFGISSATG